MGNKLFLFLMVLQCAGISVFSQTIGDKNTDTIIIKFKEGSYVRQKKERSVFNLAIMIPKMAEPLNKTEIDMLSYKLLEVGTSFGRYGTYTVNRLFTESEKFYDDQKNYLDSLTDEGDDIADFNLYYQFTIRYRLGNSREKLLAELKANSEIVEAAYPMYHAVNASSIRNAKGIAFIADYTGMQNYLRPAPLGIDARFAWTLTGGLGDGVMVIDIEKNWNDKHRDLNTPVVFRKGNNKSIEDSAHGTAVLGEMFAKHDGFGIDGIIPNSKYGMIAVNEHEPVSKAILKAVKVLKKGDIMLIEQHAPGPNSGKLSICNHEQFEFVPMEYWQDCFDAIKAATRKGIIVVEAAGNGQMNLDDTCYHNIFNKEFYNSKAILVGADEGGNGIPACFTNYGSRIDFYAWGDSVTTLGYGDLNLTRKNADSSYTAIFGGTSSAVPIVAGAIASIQAIRRAQGKNLWTGPDFISNMKGTNQMSGTLEKYIGIQPDIRRTIAEMK